MFTLADYIKKINKKCVAVYNECLYIRETDCVHQAWVTARKIIRDTNCTDQFIKIAPGYYYCSNGYNVVFNGFSDDELISEMKKDNNRTNVFATGFSIKNYMFFIEEDYKNKNIVVFTNHNSGDVYELEADFGYVWKWIIDHNPYYVTINSEKGEQFNLAYAIEGKTFTMSFYGENYSYKNFEIFCKLNNIRIIDYNIILESESDTHICFWYKSEYYNSVFEFLVSNEPGKKLIIYKKEHYFNFGTDEDLENILITDVVEYFDDGMLIHIKTKCGVDAILYGYPRNTLRP